MMKNKIHYLIIFVLLMPGFCFADGEDEGVKDPSHVIVSMRMVGHQVLLAVGDSTSLVKPIIKNGDQYIIALGAEFGFYPDSLSHVIDSVIEVTDISSNYVVEFVSCDSNLIVHSYEVGEAAYVLACRGRPQPASCYDIYITLLDADSTGIGISEPMVLVESEESAYSGSLLAFVLVVLILIGVIIFLISQKSGKNKDPHVIQIGEFLFNKRNMNLTIHDNKIELTGKEADLLQLLSDSVNDTVERDDILKSVWGDDGDYVGRTLDVFISKLRKKLEADSNVKIINIRGIGYKLVLSE